MELEKVIEAILFIENESVPIDKFVKKINLDKKNIENALDKLEEKYKISNSALTIIRLEDSYKMSVKPEVSTELSKIYKKKKPSKKLTKSILETLAIIAYKQPITKAETEDVRGVNSQAGFKILLEDGFIESAGKKNAPGKPLMYRTTEKFLIHFNLKSLAALPPLKGIKNYDFLNLDDEDDDDENIELS